MKYPIIGIILSVAAATAGIVYDINALLIGGIVFFLCSAGTVIGIRLRHKKDKLLPVLIGVGALATVAALMFVNALHH